MSIIAIIPAYNEATTIADIVRRTQPFVTKIIVVDDGSQDSTALHAQQAGAQVRRQPFNQGKGVALWCGMQAALAEGATAVITLDADGQHCPEDLPKLLDVHQRRPDALLIAARLEHRHRAPRLRRFANAMADFWVSWAAGWPIRDTQSGFRLYPALLLHQLSPPRQGQGGFVFESELLIRAVQRGYYPVTVAVATLYLVGSRPSHYRPWQDTLRITRMVAWSLLKRGLYPLGLLRSLGAWPVH